MKKTFAAFVAVATIAGSLAATPASAQRGVAAGVVGGLIGGAIIGGAIASSRPAYGGGMVTAGASAASRSATDLTGWRGIHHALILKTRPMFRPGFFFFSAPRRSSAAPLRSASNPP